MYRAAGLILALVAVVFFAAQLAEEPVRAIQKPEVRQAPEAFEKAGVSGAQGRDAVGQAPDAGDLKIGASRRRSAFQTTRSSRRVPTRAMACVWRGSSSTPARVEEEQFVLITRDLKSRYSDYDAVSVEFTDTEDVLFYNDDPRTRDLLVLLRWRAHLQYLRGRLLPGLHLRSAQHGRLLCEGRRLASHAPLCRRDAHLRAGERPPSKRAETPVQGLYIKRCLRLGSFAVEGFAGKRISYRTLAGMWNGP